MEEKNENIGGVIRERDRMPGNGGGISRGGIRWRYSMDSRMEDKEGIPRPASGKANILLNGLPRIMGEFFFYTHIVYSMSTDGVKSCKVSHLVKNSGQF